MATSRNVGCFLRLARSLAVGFCLHMITGKNIVLAFNNNAKTGLEYQIRAIYDCSDNIMFLKSYFANR